MSVRLIEARLTLELSGVGKMHDAAKSYAEELIELLDIVWARVKSQQIPNTGINHAVYDAEGNLFAGVVVTQPGAPPAGLETRKIEIARYLHGMHAGPYQGLVAAHARMREEIARRGLAQAAMVIEIYGHWSAEPSQLETQLIYAVN